MLGLEIRPEYMLLRIDPDVRGCCQGLAPEIMRIRIPVTAMGLQKLQRIFFWA
jgi:hypothetical protein